MVSTLDSGSNSLGSSPGQGHFRTRHFTFTVPLSTQVYKWVLVNLMLGVALHWTSIKEGNRINLVASCTEPEIRA